MSVIALLQLSSLLWRHSLLALASAILVALERD